MAKLTMPSVGPFLRPSIRSAVSRLRFEGYTVELWEGNGWLSREMIIKGDDQAIAMLVQWLRRIEVPVTVKTRKA